MKKREIVLFGIALVVLLPLLSFLYSFTLTGQEEISLTPIFDDARGWKIYALEKGEQVLLDTSDIMDFSDTVYLEREISGEWIEQGYSRIRLSADQWTSVFVDEKLVYTNCPDASNSLPVTFPQKGDIDYNNIPSFSLDASWAGKTITVATAVKEEFMGMPAFFLSSDSIVEGAEVAWANEKTMPATMFAVLGFLLFILFLYSLMRKQKDRSLLVLAAASFLQMLYLLSSFSNFALFNQLQPLFTQGFLLLPMLYMALHMEKHKTVFTSVLLFCWGVPFAVLILTYFVSVPFWLQNFAPYLMLLPMALCFPFGILENKNGNSIFRPLMSMLCVAFGAVAVLFLISFPVLTYFPDYVGILSWVRYLVFSALDWMPIFLMHVLNTLLFLVLFITAALVQIRKSAQAAEQVHLLTLKNDLILENLQLLERGSTALAVARHDELHHLRTIAELSSESPKQAAAYATSLADELGSITPIQPYTENRLINTILTVQAGKAAADSVRFEAQAILQEHLSIPDKDLCTVLMNLLENAVHAAAKSPEEKRVFVRLFIEEGYLYIVIENTLPFDFDPALFKKMLGKKEPPSSSLHGFGLISARTTLSRYGGELRYSINSNSLVLQTAMRLNS